MASKSVEFKTADDVTLRGDLYLPENSNSAKLVILTHGLTLLKEQFLPNYAKAFQAAGIGALVYDHRGYGSSDGYPRSETNIVQQIQDMHDAVTYTESLQPEVDPKKIVVWGIGHSGGMAMMAAALDPRVAGLIVMMPFTSGTKDKVVFPTDKVWENMRSQTATTIRIWPSNQDDDSVLLRGKDRWDFIELAREMTRQARGLEFPNALTLRSFYHIGSVDPVNYIHLIAPRPLLYLASQIDTLTGPVEWHSEVFSKAGDGPKEFVILQDHHLGTYVGETFKTSAGKQIDFLHNKV